MKKLKLNLKMKKTVCTPDYIRTRLDDGGYTTLLSEMRREGPTGLVTLAEIHANEKLRELRIRKSLIGNDQNLVVAINTASWTLGAFQINAPEQELTYEPNPPNVEDGNAQPSDEGNHPHVQDVADFQIEMTTKAVEVSKSIIDGIRDETIQSYEDIIAKIADKNLETLALGILGQSKKPIMELETPQGRLVIGGHFDLTDAISSKILKTATCDVRGVNDDENECGSISFRVAEVLNDTEITPFQIFKDQQLTARFFTVNDERSKRLLHYAKYIGQFVLLKLQFEYIITTGRWNCLCVSIENEADLVAMERVPQRVFDLL